MSIRPDPSVPQAIDPSLQAEYYHLQKTIEDFDGRALTIKAWSVTFGLAALAGAFASRASLVFLIAAIAAGLFWLLESAWKTFQLGYSARVERIEAHFRGETTIEAPHQISTAWRAWWKSQSWWVLGRTAVWLHVAFPHAFVVACGVLCYLFVPFPPK